MTLQVTGKNMDAGEAFKSYVSAKISTALAKYITPEIHGHVRIEKERGRFRTGCSIRLATGHLIEAHGEAPDAYVSADMAVERLEKRVRRYKRRLKKHHNGQIAAAAVPEVFARDAVVQVEADTDETSAEAGSLSDAPVIVAEEARGIRELPVSEAVMQLDLTDAAFLLFRNAAHGGLNVVYRRSDGNIGWIDPQQNPQQFNGKEAR